MNVQSLKYPSRGTQYSVLLHGLLLAALIFGLPKIWHRPDDMLSSPPVLVELVREVINAPPKVVPPALKDPVNPVLKDNGHTSAGRVPTPPVVQRNMRRPTDTTHQQQEFASVMKKLTDGAHLQQTDKRTEMASVTPQAAALPPSPGLPLTPSDIDLIRAQVQQYWNAPVGAKDFQNLTVTLHVQLSQDGSVLKVELAREQSRYTSEPFFHAAADAAIRAVERSSPLKGLPPEKYGTWGDMEFGFNPSDM